MSGAAPTLLTAAELRGFSDTLLHPDLIYFPVRHHSPACAFHVRKLIAERRPAQILIEGPNSFDALVPLLADAEAKPPLAVYSYCSAREAGKRRRGAYYPLCDYSPEWVALREGRAIGAEIKFIDLDFPQQLTLDRGERLSGRLATLLGERHLARSAYLRRLAAERGCRDHDELWDRLFEAWATRISSEEFVAQVAAYCRLARQDVSDAEHEHDGTLAREAEMAWHIGRAKQRGLGPILVVTGGYYSPAAEHVLGRLESLAWNPGSGFVAQLGWARGRLRARPLAILQRGAERPVDNLHFDPAPTQSRTSAWLAKLRAAVGRALPDAPQTLDKVTHTNRLLGELEDRLTRIAERGSSSAHQLRPQLQRLEDAGLSLGLQDARDARDLLRLRYLALVARELLQRG